MKKQFSLLAAALLISLFAQAQWVTNVTNTYHNNTGSVVIEPGLPSFIVPSAKFHIRNFSSAPPWGILVDMTGGTNTSPIGIRSVMAVTTTEPGNPTAIFGNAICSNTANNRTAIGISGRASLAACGFIPVTPTAPVNYAIGLYGIASAPCPANAFALYADGRTFTPGGVWTASDERLKTNIRSIPSALTLISSLQPKAYNFAADGRYANAHLPKGTHYGFLAQDLEKLIPAAVTEAPLFLHNKGDENPTGDVEQIKAVNYTALIPVLTQAIQEQQILIEALQAEVNTLKKERKAESLPGAVLHQNQPNPAASSTVIRYELPGTVQQALLMVYDLQGRQMKQIPLSGRSNAAITLPAGQLPAGAYYYTLIADGKEVATRKMILTAQ